MTPHFTGARWLHLLASLLATLLAATSIHATEPAPLPDRWLEWKNNHAVYPQALAECDASQGLAQAWDQALQRLASAVAQSGGAVPPGTFAEFRGTMGTSLQDGQPCKGRPIMGTLAMGYWPERVVTTTPGARPRLKSDHGEHFILTLWLNTFVGVGAQNVPGFLRGNAQWTGIGLISATSTFQGLQVINGSVLVLTPPGRPPAYVPMPLDRALKLWLPVQAQLVREQEDLVKQYPAPQREEMRKRAVEPQQSLLARGQALMRRGEDALKGPAYWRLDRDSYGWEIVAQPGPDTSAIVMPNPAFFDPRLPRSAVQLVMVSIDGLKLDEPAVPNGDAFDSTHLTRQFVEKVDWKAIAKHALRY